MTENLQPFYVFCRINRQELVPVAAFGRAFVISRRSIGTGDIKAVQPGVLLSVEGCGLHFGGDCTLLRDDPNEDDFVPCIFTLLCRTICADLV